ncbi:MAG: 16S rRNA (guanine(966)-N(2))-methyltransferase RsmD [Bacteroidia bacterium]|nr:16S rRNA (guanine(966)-N(2))-methyltransferase RsmD [Bacteroidia bacterium]
MRILRGKWQGRAIPFPEGAPTRPLTEKAREALFNILSHRWRIEGSRVIDLFAGTGAVGLEFLSRGATHAIFVEKDYRAAQALRQLLRDWEAPAELHQVDVISFLRCSPTEADFIFAGPPFRYWKKKDLLTLIFQNRWLRSGGCLILEHPTYEDYNEYPGFWRSERYVASTLSFFIGL